jgi:hypothetical protein
MELTGVSKVFTASIIRATYRGSSHVITRNRALRDVTNARFGFVRLTALEVKSLKSAQTEKTKMEEKEKRWKASTKTDKINSEIDKCNK